MDYVYLMVALALGCLWVSFYWVRPDLRKKILFSSLLAGSGGVGEVAFVPSYWNPRFHVIRILDDLFLESFLFTFFLGGAASVFYQVAFRKRLLNVRRVSLKVLVLIPIYFVVLRLLIPQLNIIFFLLGAGLTLMMLFALLEGTLIRPMALSGLLLLALSLVIYVPLWRLFPSFGASYNTSELTGISLLGIPAEELLFYLAFGAVWCVVYELFGNSRFRRMLGYFYD
jgi:hypothetical protein